MSDAISSSRMTVPTSMTANATASAATPASSAQPAQRGGEGINLDKTLGKVEEWMHKNMPTGCMNLKEFEALANNHKILGSKHWPVGADKETRKAMKDFVANGGGIFDMVDKSGSSNNSDGLIGIWDVEKLEKDLSSSHPPGTSKHSI